MIDLCAKRIEHEFENIFDRMYFEKLYMFLKYLHSDGIKIEIDKLFDVTLFNPLSLFMF